MTNLKKRCIWSYVAFLLCISSFSCKQKSKISINPSTEECTEVKDKSLEIFKLKYSGCRSPTQRTSLQLYAHTFETTLHYDVCLVDVFTEESKALACPPGPFLIEEGVYHNLSEHVWGLSKTPDYFVWHLENRASLDESFYITNQNGMPLKSQQTLRLQKNNDASIILLLKTNLVPGTKYYIYLTQKNLEKSIKWIQPITIMAAKEKI